MESFHLEYSNCTADNPKESNGLLNLIRFDKLTTLSLNALELLSGDFFETVRPFLFSIGPNVVIILVIY